MKVILITNFAHSIILFRLSLLVTLKEHGAKVIACAPSTEQKIVDQLSRYGIRFIKIELNRTGLNPLFDLYSSFKLYKIFKKEKPSIILNYTLKPVIYGSLMGYCARVPHIFSVITGFGSVFIDNNKKIRFVRFIVEKLYWLAFKLNNRVFVLNQDILQYFTSNNILQKNKAILINGEGLDISHYNFAPIPAVPIFLMIARLIKDKGIYEYVQAAKHIKTIYPRTRFLLVGFLDNNPSAINKNELDNFINAGNIEYLGKLEDVRTAISQASIFVLPSYAEGMPRSTLEAMSMGRPIITTDAPGCRETVIDGVNGFLVPMKNVEKLVEAMEKFILYPELIPKMGKESRRIAEEKYDVNKVNQVILKEMGII